MEGALSLDISLRNERGAGFEEFSELVKTKLPRNLEEVIDSTVADKNGQFVLIRKTREDLGDDRTEDKFSEEKVKLRKWVGL